MLEQSKRSIAVRTALARVSFVGEQAVEDRADMLIVVDNQSPAFILGCARGGPMGVNMTDKPAQ